MRSYLGIGRGHFLLAANLALLAAIMLAVASPVNAQESSVLDPPQATTDSDAEIPVDQLQVTLRPLTKDELEVELSSWLDLLRAKIREVGDTELKLMALAEGESGDELTDQVFALRTEETAIVQHATEVLMEITSAHKLILDEPPVMVQVDELADSSVNLLCRPWVKTKDYWPVHWDLTRQVKERFDAEGISIPFPQRDVHMHPESVPV